MKAHKLYDCIPELKEFELNCLLKDTACQYTIHSSVLEKVTSP